MVSRGVGILVKSLAGLTCFRATRCSSHPSTLSLVQCVTTRWFSKSLTPEDFSQTSTKEDPPKRPLSAFFRFSLQRKPELMKQHPGTSVSVIAKHAGLEWRSLSEAEKQIYIDAARADILKYRDTLQNYKDKFDPLEWKALKERKTQMKEKRKAKRLKRMKTMYGRPKQCRHAFNIFMAEHYPEAKGDSLSTKMKHLRHEWSVLPSSNKQVYMQLAEDDKVRYENEMKVWEDQMIEIGRHDLIRRKQRVLLLGKKSSRKQKASSKKKSEEDSKTATRKKSPKKSPEKHEE